MLPFLLVSVGGALRPAGMQRGADEGRAQAARLSQAEFSRLIADLSEEDGYFSSDNLVSNETSYLHVAGKLREMKAAGGAYIGVGPEQNFTYIALVRPAIAFILDIRRQAMIQQLLYKAVFHASEDRAAFLSNLLCRPLEGDRVPGSDAAPEALVRYFESVASPDDLLRANLSRWARMIEQDFEVPLSTRDRDRLETTCRQPEIRQVRIAPQEGRRLEIRIFSLNLLPWRLSGAWRTRLPGYMSPATRAPALSITRPAGSGANYRIARPRSHRSLRRRPRRTIFAATRDAPGLASFARSI